MDNYIKDRLLKENDPEEEGTWKILGEDPNCDLGGSHFQPDLGTVSGRYKDVIEYALTLTNFVQWGYGGNIKKIGSPKVKSIPKGFTAESLSSLYEQKKKLQKELNEIEEKISNLDIDYE